MSSTNTQVAKKDERTVEEVLIDSDQVMVLHSSIGFVNIANRRGSLVLPKYRNDSKSPIKPQETDMLIIQSILENEHEKRFCIRVWQTNILVYTL
jgi:hypothetical protein